MLTTKSKDWHIDDCASTEEWAEKRKDGIGASALGTLLGLSHYKNATRQHLYATIQGLIPPMEQTPAMELGHLMEPVIAELFHRRTKYEIMEESAHDFLCIDNDKPWRRVSPDRFIWPEGTPEAERTVDNADILEIKYIAASDPVARWKCVPITRENFCNLYPEYFAQVQYQMGVCRKSRCCIAWIDKGSREQKFDYLWIDFNPGYFEMAMQVLDAFWLNNILPCVEPEEIENGDDAILKFRSEVPDTSLCASTELETLVKRHAVLKAIIEKAESANEEIEGQVRMTMGLNEKLSSADGEKTLATWKSSSGSSRFNSKALAKDDPELYAKYMVKGNPTRTLRFTSAFSEEVPKLIPAELDKLAAIALETPAAVEE